MKRMQKFVSGWLVFCLLISMLPMSVFATEDLMTEPVTATENVTEPATEPTVATESTTEVIQETVAETTEATENSVPTKETTIPETEAETETTTPETEPVVEETIPETEETVPPEKEIEVAPIEPENVVLEIMQGTILRDVEYVSKEDAVLQLRENLKQRNTEFTIYVQTTGFEPETFFWNSLFEPAIAHTGNPTEGDYISWHMNRISVSSDYEIIDGVNYVAMEVSVTYLSSAEQEVELDAVYAEVLEKLALSGKTDYQKVCAIYHYITDNIIYDYANKEDGSNLLKHSAYAALVQKTCVCQGYANLFYRMALDAGLDCRIISGQSNGEKHSWNIVCVDGKYYNIDSTWDAEYTQHGFDYGYFLKCDANFMDHTRDDEYLTSSFTSQYPISEEAYAGAVLADQQEGNFIYSVSGGRATLTKYIGNETHVVVPATLGGYPVSTIGSYAFFEENNPNTVTETITFSEGILWGQSAHIELYVALKSVHYPSTMRFIPSPGGVTSAPTRCWALEKITVAENNPYMTVVDNVLYSKDMKTLIFVPTNDPREEFTILDGVEVIDNSAFEDNKNLKKLSMPNTVKKIGYWAFSWCENLEQLNISENCEFIGQFAFSQTAITAYHFPATLQLVVPGAFGSGGKETTITVDEKNPIYFAVDNTLYLKPPDDPNRIFLVRYPAGDTRNKYTIPEGTTDIMDSAFDGVHHLRELTIPDSLRQIQEYGFEGSDKFIIYYPKNSSVWTETTRQNYGGMVTWLEYGTEHEHTIQVIPGRDPGCNYPGFTDIIVCSVCGELFAAQETIPPVGHIWEPATCISAKQCKRCGLIEGEALGHSEEIIIGKKGSCTETGLTDGKKCSVCKTVIVEQTVIEARGHDEHKVAGWPATCTEPGMTETVFCEACDTILVEQKMIPARGHTWDEGIQTTDPTENATGIMTYNCTVCREIRTEEIPVLEHVHDYHPTVVAPTCMEQGYTTYTCACGDSYQDNYVTPLGHTEEIIAGKPASCTEPGLTEGKHCSVCNEVLKAQEVVEAIGHHYTSGICDRCGIAQPGDVTRDGKISEEDAIYLIWHTLFPEIYPLDKTAADLNADGAVTDADALTLLWQALFPE